MKKVLIAISAALLVAGCVFASIFYIDNKKGNFSEDNILYVYPDMTSEDILDSLASVTLNTRSLARCFRKEDVSQKVKPGRYVIHKPAAGIYVARMLKYGWQTPGNLTLSGTIRNKGILAKKISDQMMVDSASVASALDSAEFLSGYGFTPENVFALFLPDTYQMYWTASVKDIFDRMKKEYDAFWTPERVAKSEALKHQSLSRL